MAAMKRPKLKPLDITCTSTDCEKGLHCFKATRKMLDLNQEGACRDCGAELVNWKRVHEKNLADAPHTIQMLEYELIRHHFWHVAIDQRAINHARRKGKRAMWTAVENRIRNSVAKKTAFDGRQTPKSGNAVFYAQHATACCCRKCIEEWHGIADDHVLTNDEIKYLTELCVLYIDQRLPQLTEYGEKVPSIKRNRGSQNRENS